MFIGGGFGTFAMIRGSSSFMYINSWAFHIYKALYGTVYFSSNYITFSINYSDSSDPNGLNAKNGKYYYIAFCS